jgi:EmrB/QacA subfamily drug resistance transporter
VSAETITPAIAETAVTAGKRRWIALALVCLATLMNTLDGSVVNVALPKIQSDLGFSQANLSWVLNAYLITFGSFLLLAGRLGDLVGRKRVFLAGVAIFTAASLVCGVASSELMLVGARAVQGFGSAVSSSVIIAMIITEFLDPAERARAMGAYIFVAVGGGAVGLLVGGVLTQTVNWHWIFFINIPIGLVTLALGARLLEGGEGIGLGEGIDWFGSILVTAALMSGIYGIVEATSDGWTSATTLGFGALGVVLLAGFFTLEARISNPILPLGVLRIPGLLGTCAVRGLVSSGWWATLFLGALYLERIRGFGALETGIGFLPMAVAVGALSLGITARMQRRFGAMQVAISGLVVSTAGLLLLSTAGVHSGYFPRVFVALALLGLGSGSAFIPLLTLAMAQVPRELAGIASGVVNVSMQISAAIGVALLATISTDRAQALTVGGDDLTHALAGGYQRAFLVAAGLSVLGALIALLVLPGPSRALTRVERP